MNNNQKNKPIPVTETIFPSTGKWILIITVSIFLGNLMVLGIEKSIQHWEQGQLADVNAIALEKLMQEKAKRAQIEEQARQHLRDAVKKIQ